MQLFDYVKVILQEVRELELMGLQLDVVLYQMWIFALRRLHTIEQRQLDNLYWLLRRKQQKNYIFQKIDQPWSIFVA